MARKKGVAPNIKILGGFAPIQPIPRERDNTDDLELAEQRVHTRMGHFKAKGAGTFEPAGGTDAFNGNTVTSPPYNSG